MIDRHDRILHLGHFTGIVRLQQLDENTNDALQILRRRSNQRRKFFDRLFADLEHHSFIFRCSHRRSAYRDVFFFAQVDHSFDGLVHLRGEVLAKLADELQRQLLLLRTQLRGLNQVLIGSERFGRVVRAILIVENVVQVVDSIDHREPFPCDESNK